MSNADTLEASLKSLFGGSCPKREEAAIVTALQELRSRLGQAFDLNIPITATGSTALHAACWFRRPTVVRWLLQNGARPGVETNKGNTPMHFVCENADKLGADAVFTLLLAANASATAPIPTAELGIDSSPLSKCPSAQIRQHLEGIANTHAQKPFQLDELVVAALPPSGQVNVGSAVHSNAIQKNDPKALLRAEQAFTKLKTGIERMDTASLQLGNSSTVAEAMETLNTEEAKFVQMLEEYEALFNSGLLSINRACSSDQSSFLHLATRMMRPSLLAACLVIGADCNLANAQRRTPLHIAVQQMDTVLPGEKPASDSFKTLARKTLELLLDHGGDIRQAADVQGMVPLELAPSATSRAYLTSRTEQPPIWTPAPSGSLTLAFQRISALNLSALEVAPTTTATTVAPTESNSASSQLEALAAELARADVEADRQRAADAAELRQKLANKGGKRSGALVGVGRAAASLLESLEEQAQASLAAAGDERSSADNELQSKLAARRERDAARAQAALNIDLDPSEFSALFDYIDTYYGSNVELEGQAAYRLRDVPVRAPRGVLDVHQLADYHRQQHCCELGDKWVACAVAEVSKQSGLIEKPVFFKALAAIHLTCHRWHRLWFDFQLLNYEHLDSITMDAASSIWELNKAHSTIKFSEFLRQRAKEPQNDPTRVSWAEFEEYLVARSSIGIK